MATEPMIRQPAQPFAPGLFAKTLAALGTGFALAIAGMTALTLGFQLLYIGRVLPGVSVAGIDVAGVRRAQAAALVGEQLRFPIDGAIAISDHDDVWAFRPIEVGYVLDAEASAEAAYRVGRQGWPWTRLREQFTTLSSGIDIAPRMVFDGRIAQRVLEGIAAEINQPTLDASLSIDGLNVIVQLGQIGRTLDVWATSAVLAHQLSTLHNGASQPPGSIRLVVAESPPVILDASAQAALAQEILSRPLALSAPGGATNLTLSQEDLAEMLSIERVATESGQTYQVGLDASKLAGYLLGIAPDVQREPENTRYIFNDDTRQLEVIRPAVIGQTLQIEESVAKINQELQSGAHDVALVFDYTQPAVTDERTGADLGITELVSAETTYFYGSSVGRMQNIELAASQFHGLLVPPGATFSMVENIGDISLDSGYAESLIIFGDRTIAGVGGGVCQVSTTLFRAVFFGGFPVVERYSHAYRVYYYELNQSGSQVDALAGLDATVYAPIVDFKFTNDTPYWLLMETYVYTGARSITWKFYSTSDGRTVDWTTSGLRNVVEPPDPVYEVNEELGTGDIEQVDWAVEGADVSITRTVHRGGQVYFTDQFNTHYEPWKTVCEYGPGTQNYPPKEKDQDTYSCRNLKSSS
jgi:vancomycin resistance protein YoaR